ncbi:COG3415 family protein [Tautonia plasticadhaerens]|uniref:Uncharacterized protein n=1 Tax=Tautonia plasticadhaerens TaxID=2527974 RepID=A0A518H317_9BACT|nr:hypothetical protein [Tautonia plasticadhaerens]QDV35226.1 hypothetical protein ElP_31290 [Tautonia plasticadhaerens]
MTPTPIRLTERERERLQGMSRRPRSKKQGYRSRALLALDGGHSVETVARMFRVGVDRVESWVAGFLESRLAYLDEPPGFRARARREEQLGGEEADGEEGE